MHVKIIYRASFLNVKVYRESLIFFVLLIYLFEGGRDIEKPYMPFVGLGSLDKNFQLCVSWMMNMEAQLESLIP